MKASHRHQVVIGYPAMVGRVMNSPVSYNASVYDCLGCGHAGQEGIKLLSFGLKILLASNSDSLHFIPMSPSSATCSDPQHDMDIVLMVAVELIQCLSIGTMMVAHSSLYISVN